MTYAAPNRGPVQPVAQTDALSSVLRVTERCFVEAGDGLALAVETLRGNKAMFARLDETMGEETGRHLAELIARVFGNAGAMRNDFDAFLQQSIELRTAVRGVKVEVGELDRVVRTIASVSINARILGNALTPPRPQVNSFITRLAEMSSEAEGILREVKDAMAGIGRDTDSMDEILQELRQNLTQHVLPDLARFAAIAQKVQDGRSEMTVFTADLAERMKSVFTEVSRLIVALQTGDSTRQRLQRVQEVMSLMSPEGRRGAASAGDLDRVLAELARALVDGARTDAEDEVEVSIGSLESVRDQAAAAIQTARHFYFARAGRDGCGAAGAGTPGALDESLGRVRRHLVSLRGRAEALAGRLDVILRHEATIRQIAQQVRLSGLNAVLICAKLGDEGRSLRELAQWLRALTDESDDIVSRLQGKLAETRARTDAAGQSGVDRLERALAGFLTDADALNGAMVGFRRTVTDTARGFDVAGRDLPLQIGQAIRQMIGFRAALAELGAFSAMLGVNAAGTAPLARFAEGSPEAVTLARLRAHYTMQQERVIHDAIAGSLPPTLPELAKAVAEAPQASVAVADEGLDDILF